MELAGQHDIVIERNADFRFTVSEDDGNGQALRFSSAHLQVRRDKNDPTVLLDLSTENGGIELSDDHKTLTHHLPAERTMTLQWLSGWYDLRAVDEDSGEADRLLEGRVSVSREVTRG